MKMMRTALLALMALSGTAQATVIGYDVEFYFEPTNFQHDGTVWGVFDSKLTIDLDARALTSISGAFTRFRETEPEFVLSWSGYSPISTKFEPALSYPETSTFLTNFGLVEFDSGATLNIQLEQIISAGAEPLLSINQDWEGSAGDFTSSLGEKFWLELKGASEPYVVSVPEPATLSLLALGLAAIGIRRRLR